MQSSKLQVIRNSIVLAAALMGSAGTSFAQTLNLTAMPATAVLPDGQAVPMWGLACGSTTAPASGPAPTCTAATGVAQTPGMWQPPLIRVQGTALTINLTNSLPTGVPTSLTIVGQLGGGLGTAPIPATGATTAGATTAPSPVHPPQGATWPIVSDNSGPVFTPPAQSSRVQSFATEVVQGTPATLTWTGLKPGTYLIESGTHPSIQGPMGLYGMVVVTAAAGTAYPGIAVDADAPLLLSEIDPVQNNAVSAAVNTPGFSESATYTLKLGSSINSIALASGGKNYTTATVIISGGGGSGATATATIDTTAGSPTYHQITAINLINAGAGYTTNPTVTISGNGTGAAAVSGLLLAGSNPCGSAAACYPPAVNYDPRYYLVNGVAFDKTNAAASTLSGIVAPAGTGKILVRFVNAGLRMHVPSIVGAQTLKAGATAAVPGLSLIAEDGNPLPGVARIQNEVFLAAGKTYDAMITAPPAGAAALPLFDRQLSLSTNNFHDGGMVAYLGVNGAAAAAGNAAARANPDKYTLPPGGNLTVVDALKGVVANDVGVYGVSLLTGPTAGAVNLNADGTFTYVPNTGTTSDSFVYQANGNPSLTATVTLAACTGSCIGGAPSAVADNFPNAIASRIQIGSPGVLANDTDPSGHPLKAVLAGTGTCGTVDLKSDGSFTATPSAPGVSCSFTYNAVNSQNTSSATPASVTVAFPAASGLTVNVVDAQSTLPGATKVQLNDYRWIIEEDRTFLIDPATQVTTGPPCTSPGVPIGCAAAAPTLGTNFHTSYMPVVAAGCVGTVSCEAGQTLGGVPAVCDVGNGACRTGAAQQTAVDPSQVHLDPTKRYYISILPGDAGNSFSAGAGAPVDLGNGKSRPFSIIQDCPSGNHLVNGVLVSTGDGTDFAPGSGSCGHGMGGANITAASLASGTVQVTLEQTPLQPTKVAVFVFEDDYPLNGENDAGGGVDALAIHETGLGGFQIRLFDDAGGTGDATGQMTYDMFNMPLSNSLAGTPDPQHPGNDACPITQSPDFIVGMIVTCPHFESDGVTVSPLEGQAVIANLMPGRYGVVANEGADRIARGEEWLQTNTLDGQKAHDSFIKIGGPAYFQEFGPGGYHVLVGFANPQIINDRRTNANNPDYVCGAGKNCINTITGKVTTSRMSRTPDQRLYSSGSRDSLGFTQCYASLGDPDAEDFEFVKCDGDGNFKFINVPDGSWRITLFDQWNDQIVDGLSTPVAVKATSPTVGQTLDMGDIPVQQWHTNIYTRSYFDTNGDGVSNVDGNGNATEQGLSLLPTNIRFRDGSYSNFNNTDLNGYAGFNEIFPLFNWYVIEADTTRFKQTGVHVVYDAGGPADGNGGGTSTIGANLANTLETNSVPPALRIPGAVYCADADCKAENLITNPHGGGAGGSTGRIDPPSVTTEAWQGFIGQNEFVEFGKKPFAVNENGGIHGEVTYASTRPFDDPALLIHTSWTPNVPKVTINLYQESTAADGTVSLALVDTTKTTSWDDWAQGFHPGPNNTTVPNMNCPGQSPTSPFFYTLQNTPMGLNPATPLPNSSQFKCYDGFAMFNQVQPAPYDGMYKFPSVTATDPITGLPTATNCKICTNNPTGDGTKMLPAGKYVVEMILPPGYELVKEEDKNILIGDNYIAPVTQEFAGLGNIFILPDQAAVNAKYNPNNPQNPTTDLGSGPHHEGDTGSVESFWPCVGQARIVPDFISLFPMSQEVAPFAGATRNLCDRKEVILEDQSAVLAKFWVFSSTHVAAHFTGIILDDFSSEFDPFSPQYGEKFAVPNVPISFKDHAGVEVSRTYSDQWGIFNGLQYSTWEVNPPNPTGYAPTMMVTCMNDPGPIPDPAHPGQTMTDPLYNPAYSQFCYEIPFMPGQTQYMDTPVVPTAAFAQRYNLPDCAYPDATPAVKEVDGDGVGPYVSAAGKTLTITALGDQVVPNHAYTGPSATAAPFNAKTITRHYGFGSTQGTGSVKIGGVNAPVVSWSDATITVTVPTLSASQSTCSIQQRGVSGAPSRCGELVITAGNGKQSVDAVTVTIGGKAPTRVTGENAQNNAIQTAIDKATPGDLIIVAPGTYQEMILMWKPVRLQGVAAASVIVNANTHPSGRIDSWRRQAACLFGLSLNGGLLSANAFDPNGVYTCPASQAGQVDPIPLEPLVGWDPTLNGNIAELLQEPTLLGAYEGAAITVLAKGVRSPDANCTANGICVPLNAGNQDCNAWPSNFLCNPSRVDGITFTNSSQGGGGIFVHGWNHNLEVANNRVYANAGTLSGGITLGQPETTDGTIVGTREIAFGYNNNVNVHNNYVTENAAYGDELNSTTPMAAGGVTICTGSDNYKFNYNWVCGNLSTGDGGGFAHFGLSYNGTIANNKFLFNQSTNPTIPTHGGGVLITGAPPDGPVCENAAVDVDCPPSLSDGVGPGLLVDSNLILGNNAESGSGGGLRLQSINGTDVQRNPTAPGNWYQVLVTNNIIANNVAGWDGGGVSLVDALRVSFINNTVMSNDSTASSGVLFNTLGAPNANIPPPVNGGGNCDPTLVPNCDAPGTQITTSTFLPAGLVTQQNTPNMTSSMPAGGVTCPSNQPNCAKFSNPLLRNNVFWENRAFYISVGNFGAGSLSQQHLVTLLPQLSQPQADALTTVGGASIITGGTGACVANGTTYWDIGVRGDTTQAGHESGFTLNPTYSILTDGNDYGAGVTPSVTHNLAANPGVISQYCNGARVPPENGGLGYEVPPGISDATLPNPVFNLAPAATVDEGNNWINMSYGPLSLVNNAVQPASAAPVLGNYAIAAGSPAINVGTATGAPNHDFFGTQRPQGGGYDIGAVEFNGPTAAIASVTGGPLAFGSVAIGASSSPRTLTLHNTGNANLTGIGLAFSSTVYTRPAGASGGTCGNTLTPAAGTCTINVVFTPIAPAGAANATLTISGNVPVVGSPVALSGTGVAPTITAALAPTTWSPSQIRNCPGTTPAQIRACAGDPVQAFMLINTGNVTLTGIGQAVLGGVNAADYSVVRVLSTCGPVGGGQLLGQTTLAPGATCLVTVQFKPLTSDPINSVRSATVSVTDAAGTQSSALTGTAR